MLTHKQVKVLSKEWKQRYGNDAPELIKATSIRDNLRIAIHLLNPTQDDISRAFCDAQRDMVPTTIVIHTKHTFGKVRDL